MRRPPTTAGRTITLLDIAKEFGLAKAADYIDAAAKIIHLVESLPTNANTPVVFGSFEPAGDVRQLTSLSQAQRNPAAEQPRDIMSQLGAPSKAYLAEANGINSTDNKGMSFPLIENPTNAFKLLLGQDVTLFTYDMPTLTAKFSYTWRSPAPILPPFPIFARVTGFIGAAAHFSFGYDTSGFRSGNAFNGFYISDRANADGTGADVSKVTLKGGLYVAAELWLPPAPLQVEAGVGGGIFATVNFNLHDPNNDGTVRLDELKQNVSAGLINLFDVSGSLDAKLIAYLKIGYSLPFVGHITIIDVFKEIVNVTLLNFDFKRPDTTPVLASALLARERVRAATGKTPV